MLRNNMSEVLVFSDYDGGYIITLKLKTKRELAEVKRRLAGMFTFRTPNR